MIQEDTKYYNNGKISTTTSYIYTYNDNDDILTETFYQDDQLSSVYEYEYEYLDNKSLIQNEYYYIYVDNATKKDLRAQRTYSIIYEYDDMGLLLHEQKVAKTGGTYTIDKRYTYSKSDTTSEGIESIIPNISDWGISPDILKETYKADYKPCQVNGDDGLYVIDVEVDSYLMNVYYIFSNNGLSKIAYILNDDNKHNKSELEQCYQTLIEKVKLLKGEPNTVKSNTSIWTVDNFKIEVGKGKLKKYTGSDNTTVAIIFKR